MSSDPRLYGPEVCCPALAMQLSLNCPHHKGRLECPDVLIVRTSEANHQGGGFGISIKDGGSSFLKIHYCPFCGHHLSTLRQAP